jgi:hypothetical protein
VSEKAKQDLHGSIWGQATAGLVVVVVGPGVLFLLGQLAKAKVPLWLYVAGIAIVALIMTLVYAPWRRAIWVNIAKWRPFTTKGTLERARAEGRAELQEELDGKRSRPIIRARWLVSKKKAEEYTWLIMNMAEGSTARGVTLDVDASRFKIASAADWHSVDGGSVKEFKGTPTQDGGLFGVDFTIWWTDANDARQYVDVPWKGYNF